MKLETAKNFQFFLFAGQFETLESKLIQHYYLYIMAKFQIQRSCYQIISWLLGRSIRESRKAIAFASVFGVLPLLSTGKP